MRVSVLFSLSSAALRSEFCGCVFASKAMVKIFGALTNS